MPERKRRVEAKGVSFGEQDMTKQAEGIINSIRRTLRFLVIVTGLLGTVLVGVATFTYLNSQEVNDAICNLRADLERRVITSQEFLEKHPRGVGGISREDILVGIENQQRTITALASLNCD